MLIEGIIFFLILATAKDGMETTIDDLQAEDTKEDGTNPRQAMSDAEKVEFRRLHNETASRNIHLMF